MSNSEDHHLFLVIVIQHDIRSLSKFDNPFPELRQHFLNGTTYPRLFSDSFHTLSNHPNGTLRCFRTLRSKKPMKAAYIEQSRLRPD